jgi:hypothetical protein
MNKSLIHVILVFLLIFCVACAAFFYPQSPHSYEDVTPITYATGIWGQTIGGTPAVDPQSDLYIDYMKENYRDKFVLVIQEGSVTVFYADSSDPEVSIPLSVDQYHNGRKAAGIKNVPIPDYFWPDAANDGHAVIVIPWKNQVIDFWQMRYGVGKWEASVAVISPLNGTGIHTEETVRASGFVLPAGVIWPQEIRPGGSINHALAMGYAHTRKDSFIPPAIWSDGWDPSEYALPIGAHLQLDPTFNLNDPAYNLTDYEKEIGLAMQIYGLYIHDTNTPGSIIELEAINPASYSTDPYVSIPEINENGYEEGYVTLSPHLIDNLRVLDLGSIRTRDSHPLPESLSYPDEYWYGQ